MGKQVLTYFDQQAESYLERSERLPWSLFRKKERAIMEQLLQPEKHTSFLDLGAGVGYYSLYFKNKYSLRVVAVDNSSLMLSQIKDPDIECICSDISKLHLNNYFHRILAAGVFEFVSDPEDVFLEVSRILDKDGRFCILIPTNNVLGRLYQWVHQKWKVNTFIRSSQFYIELGKRVGLKITHIQKATLISSALCFEKER